MPTFITNLHSYSIPKSYQTHHIQPMNNSIHAYHSFHAFNILIHPNMWQTYKDKEENRTWMHSLPVLAQTERPHLGERGPSLRRAPFA